MPIFLFSISCSEDENLNKEELLNSLRFENNQIDSKGGVNVVIFEVYIGRASQNCQSGFGFCNFTWFPDFKDGGSINAQLESNDGENYIEVHFANEIPEGLTDEDLQIIVDDALTASNEQGDSYTIIAGSYQIDRSLGEYGGYKIELN